MNQINIETVKVNIPWISQDIDPKFIEKPCAICGGFGVVKKNLLFNGYHNEILQCPVDEHMWLRYFPSDEWENLLYSKDYFTPDTFDTSQVGIRDRGVDEVAHRMEISRIQVAEWGKHIEHLKTGIELGGGSGYLTAAAVEKGINFLNVEICQERVVNQILGRRENVFHGRLKDAMQANVVLINSCDIVACYDFLEHIDPHYILKDIYSILKPGGVIAIRIPDTPPDIGPTLHLGDHRQHFTSKSIVALLNKYHLETFYMFNSGIFYGENSNTITNITVYARKLNSGSFVEM